MKKYITILAISLICHDLFAQLITTNFPSVDDLIAHVKQDYPEGVIYDTNGIIVGVSVPGACSTDHNLHLLSQIKSIRYLLIGGIGVSTNAILALAEYPNLTGLGIVCGSGPKKDLASALPCLTNLQTLELAQTAYWTNDTIYLAKMTNLVALQIGLPQSQAELLPLTNLVNLRNLMFFGRDDYLKKVDTNIFSRLSKLTNLVVTSDVFNPAWKEKVWKMPVEK